MTKSPRRTTGVPGAKLLLTTGALGLTLGGWAMLTTSEPQPPADAEQSAQITLPAPADRSGLPPVPTVAPLSVPNSLAGAAAPEVAPAAPVLRAVPALPAVRPVARTRSSN